MAEPRFLQLDEVLAVHHDLLHRFGGLAGVRDRGLLESALAAPETTFGGQFLHPELEDMAAAYLYHLVRNHPFCDGNKRIALACAHLFLWANGFMLTSDEETTEQMVVSAATGAASEEEVAAFVRRHVRPRPDAGRREDDLGS